MWQIIRLVYLSIYLGELKMRHFNASQRILIGGLFCFIIYVTCHIFLQTPLLCVFTFPIITVLIEFPNLKFFDDNGLLTLLPLILCLVLRKSNIL